MVIFLVGYMGSGKTTIGRKLSRRFHIRFYDTDALIEEHEGASVADIFRYEGEAYFRNAEGEALAYVTTLGEPCIVSTGGGLPCHGDNMQRLNRAGITVYLRRSAENIAARLSPYGRAKRPRLRDLDDQQLVSFMRSDIARHEAAYAEAQIIIDADRCSDEEIVDRIAASVSHRNTAPVGVYDSGLGGLSVWRALRRQLPRESLVYLADGANCPYGGRPREEIRTLARAAVQKLVDEGCKLIVVACNTATAAAIDDLRERYRGIPIVGMEPAVKPACLHTRSGIVAVLATRGSLQGELFRRTSERYGAQVEILSAEGCGFVELVEQNREQTPEAEAAVRTVIEPLLARGADQLVLGCTHYPFLRPVIEKVIQDYAAAHPAGAVQSCAVQSRDVRSDDVQSGVIQSSDVRSDDVQSGMLRSAVTVIDPAPAIARHTQDLLDHFALAAPEDHTPDYRFLTFADDDYLRQVIDKANALIGAG